MNALCSLLRRIRQKRVYGAWMCTEWAHQWNYRWSLSRNQWARQSFIQKALIWRYLMDLVWLWSSCEMWRDVIYGRKERWWKCRNFVNLDNGRVKGTCFRWCLSRVWRLWTWMPFCCRLRLLRKIEFKLWSKFWQCSLCSLDSGEDSLQARARHLTCSLGL